MDSLQPRMHHIPEEDVNKNPSLRLPSEESRNHAQTECIPQEGTSRKRKFDRMVLTKENIVNGCPGRSLYGPPTVPRVTGYNMMRHRHSRASNPYLTPGYRRQEAYNHYHYYHSSQYTQQSHPLKDAGVSEDQGESCAGCLSGSSDAHLKLFHTFVTEAIYSPQADLSQIMAQQLPGYAFVHDGLSVRLERDAVGKNKIVVRGTNCACWSYENSLCHACSGQMGRVEEMLRNVSNEHGEDPDEVVKYTPPERINVVPTLAKAQIKKIVAELEDYKENGISLVRV